MAAVARELGLSWDTVNTIACDAAKVIVATDTGRLDGVRVIGVDEHRWAHVHHPGEDGYVTVIVDLTAVRDGAGRARLLDLVTGEAVQRHDLDLARKAGVPGPQDPARFVERMTGSAAVPALPLLSARRKAKLEAVFADENHLPVELCWGFYQWMIAAHAHPYRRSGKAMKGAVIDALRSSVPGALDELAALGRTL